MTTKMNAALAALAENLTHEVRKARMDGAPYGLKDLYTAYLTPPLDARNFQGKHHIAALKRDGLIRKIESECAGTYYKCTPNGIHALADAEALPTKYLV